jgi:hypothetical protein
LALWKINSSINCGWQGRDRRLAHVEAIADAEESKYGVLDGLASVGVGQVNLVEAVLVVSERYRFNIG